MQLSRFFEDPEVRTVVEEAQLRAQEKLRKLSPRQREVLTMMVEGHPNKIIAYKFGLSQRSVENHRAAIMGRLEVKSFAALVRLFVLAG